jgi:PAS domain S-box-containing protein
MSLSKVTPGWAQAGVGARRTAASTEPETCSIASEMLGFVGMPDTNPQFAAPTAGEGKFRRLLEAAPDAMVVANRDGQIVLVNAQTERLFGYTSGELAGQSVETLVPESLRQAHHRHRMDYQAAPHPRPMGSGLELFGRRKNGTLFPVEISLSPFAEPGEFLVIAAIRDISDRKAAQQALRLSEERFRLLVNEVKDYAIFMLDPEGRVRSWNEGARTITGYPAEEILGQHFSRFYTEEDAQRGSPARELESAGAQGRSEHEGWRVRKDGSRFWASVITTALHDGEGRPFGFTQVLQDTTARKKARETFLLEVANALVSTLDLPRLLAAISSCLRQVKPFDFATLALFDQTTKMLKTEPLDERSARESPQDELISPTGDSPAAWVFNTRKPLLLKGDPSESWPCEMPPANGEQAVRSGCWLPLTGREGALGVLAILSRHAGTFTDEDLAVFRQIADQIAIALDNAMAFQRISSQKEKLEEEKLYFEDEIRIQFNIEEIVGKSRPLLRVLKQLETVAPTDSTILILGETGTGKELLARAAHNLSPRRAGTFVRVNCASIPAGLLESELFGHEKGAFTGALSQRIGRIELAHRGTLFLDEVGDIPLELQAKLLRFLQEKEFERLGSSRTLTSDARILAATNRDLKAMVAAGEFRRDLYYRVNVFPIVVPPLRDRPEDVPLLVKYFVLKHAGRLKKSIESVPPEAMRGLAAYSWPGNVRELEHLIERAVILSSTSVLNLPPFEVDLGEPVFGSGASALEEVERQHILRILRRTGGKIAGPGGAAEQLGMNRTTLNSRLRKLRISRKDFST